MVATNRISFTVFNVSSYGVAYLQSTVGNGTEMNIYAVGFLGIIYVGDKSLGIYSSRIADLTAAFTVEGSAVKYYRAVSSVNGIHCTVIGEYSYYFSGASVIGVSCKRCFGKI